MHRSRHSAVTRTVCIHSKHTGQLDSSARSTHLWLERCEPTMQILHVSQWKYSMSGEAFTRHKPQGVQWKMLMVVKDSNDRRRMMREINHRKQ